MPLLCFTWLQLLIATHMHSKLPSFFETCFFLCVNWNSKEVELYWTFNFLGNSFFWFLFIFLVSYSWCYLCSQRHADTYQRITIFVVWYLLKYVIIGYNYLDVVPNLLYLDESCIRTCWWLWVEIDINLIMFIWNSICSFSF